MHPSDDLLVLDLGGELPESERAALRAHLDGCAACAGRRAALARVDELLRTLPPLAPPPGLVARVRARHLLTPAGRTTPWLLATAAALLLAAGAAAGWALARTPPSLPPIVRNAEGPKFALIFAEDPATWADVPLEERRRRYDEFMAWLREIGDGSVRLGGTQLDGNRGRIVGASARAWTPDLVLSGFIVIRAASYEEAQRHAERCPLLARGGQVIVRQLRGP